MRIDRTVHAECDGFEVVRYDRSGKWYVEPRGNRPREHVGVNEAARRALACEVMGGIVHTGRSGGAAFDRAVVRVQGARSRRCAGLSDA